MSSPVLLLLLSLSAALAAPTIQNDNKTVIMPQKQPALVLDQLPVALQKTLHDGLRIAPLRIAALDYFDANALQALGGPPPRGRVKKCLFNVITCF